MTDEHNIELTVDNFLSGSSTVTIPMSEWSDIELITAAAHGNTAADAELDRRVTAEKAVQPDIVKVYRNAIDRAVDKLNDIPGTDDDDNLIPVPWQKTDRPKVPTAEWGDAELRSFPIESLTATQDYVRRDTVEWHLTHLNDAANDNKAMPNILQTDKGDLIYDGHHRLAALWLLGATTANCWTLEK